jgi:type II secretory pathway pseudopilin PulG
MKLFSVKKEKPNITIFLAPVLLILLLVLFSRVAGSISDSNRAQEKEFLSRALERSITQCYALEGDYPPNLDYLKENYGLTYDTEHFFVDYQYIGSNLRPDTTIIERK